MGLILMASSSLPHTKQLKLRKVWIEKSYWLEEPKVETIMGNKKWTNPKEERVIKEEVQFNM